MIIEVEGQIYRTGKTKKGQHFCNILVKRPDGQSDSLMILGNREYKAGTVFKGKVNAYIRVCSEVVQYGSV
ncbi:MAG: hypothetical protein DDT22_00688 [candidate division WS2 bacterium]|nr:hypothetical protein [Candidatus Lithacetigena glycinireducens]MBT9175014.1 hypothetical protein [Candidatus Lithacetigena glycinireducens]